MGDELSNVRAKYREASNQRVFAASLLVKNDLSGQNARFANFIHANGGRSALRPHFPGPGTFFINGAG
jgi:hypothetical protein